MRPVATDVAWYICLCVCLRFGMKTPVGLYKQVEARIFPLTGRSHFGVVPSLKCIILCKQ